MRRILGPTAAVGGAAAAVILMAGPALAAPSVTITPASGLTNGQQVTVKVTGYPANMSGLFVVECNGKAAADPGTAHCDTTNLGTMTTDASGSGSTTFKVKTGTIGDGTCAAGSTDCVIAVAPAAGGTAANTAGGAIAFAAASTGGGTTTGGSTTGGSTTGGSTTAGGSTGAVSGGTTTTTGKPFGLEMGLGAALVLAGLGAGGFALRRRVNA